MERLSVAAVQLGDRPCAGFDDYADHVRSLVGAARAQLIVFPEYGTLPLLRMRRDVPRADLRRVYDESFFPLTDRYLELFAALAHEYRVHLLAGTHWCAHGTAAKNTAFFFGPDGSHRAFAKYHPTAAEEAMGMASGDRPGMATGDRPGLVSLDGLTLGILVCYDCEFPELARSLADQGADVLLVPSLTLNERGFTRVQVCARARAVENQLYVILSTNQTALDIPTEKPVRGVGRAGIFGPIDNRTRLTDGVVAQASRDGDQVVCAELDISVLALSREASEAPLRRHRRSP